MPSPLAPIGGVAPANSANADPRAQLRAAAEQFEAVFLRQMIGAMRQAKLADDWLDSSATEQFRDMADARLADTMAQQGSFGIAELLIQQFERTAAATNGANGPAGSPGTGATDNDGAQS
jgi:flagellar protein FlgJ